jgi:succinate dehydrogenase/fumarate reductase cytochrome b subunit
MITLQQLHRIAGLTLALFIGIHLANHLVAVFSIDAHIAFMHYARLIYRNPVSEVFLLCAIAVQVPSGIILIRRKKWRGVPFVQKAQIVSGLYLAFFLVAHVFAVMMARYYFRLDTNFYFASSVLFSVVWWYYVVYYGLSIVAVFTHIASIHYQKILSKTSPKAAQMQGFLISGVGVVCAMIILLAFSGKFYAISIPQEFRLF